MRRVRVALGTRSYTVSVEPGILDSCGELMRKAGLRGKVLVATDATVDRIYRPRVVRSLKRAGFSVTAHAMKSGERYKTPSTLAGIQKALFDGSFDRADSVLALGGGVVGDTAGFAAATWHRGIALVQMPTTLLAMVDSSVGGKTGVNLPGGKNLVGSFHQPAAVLIDPETLQTLSPREYRSGLGEVVKHGMIRDEGLFERLEKRADEIIRIDPDLLAQIVTKNCRIKAEYVTADERDTTGKRAELNYGHTFGHAVETATGYKKYLHGEAVALGMTAAAAVGRELGLLSGEDHRRLIELLGVFSLPTGGVPARPAELLPLLYKDKKVEGGELRIVLTDGIGSASVHGRVERAVLRRGLAEICARGGGP